MPALQPIVWPWELLWPVAFGVALTTLALLVRRVRQRGRAGWRLVALLASSALLISAPFVLFDNWLAQLASSANIAETNPSALDPHLQTRAYALPPRVVFVAAVRVVQQTPFWHLTLQNANAGVIKAQTAVALGLFTNDVLIHVDPLGTGCAQVNVRASTRLASGDWGMSLRQIAIFYNRLDQEVANGQP